MKRTISRVALAALIATTVAPVAQAGISNLFRDSFLPISSAMLLAFGTLVGLSTPYTHKKNIQERDNELAIKNALDAIVTRLEQNQDHENQVDVNAELGALKESFPVYRTEYRSRSAIGHHGGFHEEAVAVFDHYDISQKDIAEVRKTCDYFNKVKQVYKEEQITIIKGIRNRLDKHQILTDEQLKSGKKFSYIGAAVCSALGATGLLASLYFKYAKNK